MCQSCIKLFTKYFILLLVIIKKALSIFKFMFLSSANDVMGKWFKTPNAKYEV